MNAIPNNEDGTYSLAEFEKRIRGIDDHEPSTSLAIVENTHNVCGGKVVPMKWIDELVSICKSHQIKMHMDGARVFHAAEYLNIPVAQITRHFDSITFCLSKSLCAPVGSILLGSTDFIRQARRIRKVLGGGMRQIGILAAAGLVAFEEVVPNLGDVHKRTKQIAQAIYDMKSPFVTVDIDNIQTNICMIHLLKPENYSAKYLVDRLGETTTKELADGVTDKLGNGIF